MSRVHKLGDAWPFPPVEADWKAGGMDWFETNETRWWYALEVLAPIYFPGGFYIDEPLTRVQGGLKAYSAWVQIGERYFVRVYEREKHAEAIAELKAALAAEAAAAPGT